MMNLIRSHMTILSSAYKLQMMVKVKFVNSVKRQSVYHEIHNNEHQRNYICVPNLNN